MLKLFIVWLFVCSKLSEMILCKKDARGYKTVFKEETIILNGVFFLMDFRKSVCFR